MHKYKRWQLIMYCHLKPTDAIPLPTLNLLGARDNND